MAIQDAASEVHPREGNHNLRGHSFRLFPGLLYREAGDAWRNLGRCNGSRGTGGFEFPSELQFYNLVEAAINAAITREEGRALRFSLLFTAIHGSIEQHSSSAEPDITSPWFFTSFASPVPLTWKTIRALSPALDPQNTFIVVAPRTPSCPDLEIVGLLTGGASHELLQSGESFSGFDPPPALTVHCRGVGRLTLGSRGVSMLDLSLGHISRYLVGQTTVASEFDSFVYSDADVLESAVQAAYRDQGYPNVETASPLYYRACILSIVRRINIAAHGGTLLIVNSDVQRHDDRLRSLISLKYPLNESRLWDTMLRMWSNLLMHQQDAIDNSNQRLRSPAGAVRVVLAVGEPFDELSSRPAQPSTCLQELVNDAVRFIAGLAAVDGAVVINKRLTVLGFGGEVTVAKPDLVTVDVVQADGTLATAPISDFGTRHRSAVRFVAALPESAAFVVSSDGGVRGFRNVGGGVRMWPDLKLLAFA